MASDRARRVHYRVYVAKRFIGRGNAARIGKRADFATCLSQTGYIRRFFSRNLDGDERTRRPIGAMELDTANRVRGWAVSEPRTGPGCPAGHSARTLDQCTHTRCSLARTRGRSVAKIVQVTAEWALPATLEYPEPARGTAPRWSPSSSCIQRTRTRPPATDEPRHRAGYRDRTMADETALLPPLLPPLPPPEVLVAGAPTAGDPVAHDPALYDGDEEGEEEDPYEVYVLRRPHERSSVVVPQLAKQPEMADTRLRYRRIPAEARSGSIGSLGNHFPPRFEFPNRPSLLEALTSDDESYTSLSLTARNSSARSLHRPSGPPRVSPAALASAPEPYESVADEIASGASPVITTKKRRKRRAPRPPLPRAPDAFAGSDAAAVVGPDLAAAIMASARPKHGRRAPSPLASPVSTPDSSARSGGSVESEPVSGDAAADRPRVPSRPATPTPRAATPTRPGTPTGRPGTPTGHASPPRSRTPSNHASPPRARTPDPEAVLGRLRRGRRSSPEIKRFHSAHADTTADNAARELRRRSSAGAPGGHLPAGLAEWEGRKICAPAALGGAGAGFVLLAEEPVIYQRSRSRSIRTQSAHAGFAGRSSNPPPPEKLPERAPLPERAGERPPRPERPGKTREQPSGEKTGIPRHSARMAARRKRIHRSSMRFRRSLVSPARARRARAGAAAGVSTRRSEASRRLSAAAGLTRDRELSVSTRVRPTAAGGAGPGHALRRVFAALGIGSRS